MTRRLTPTPVVGGLTFSSLAVGNQHVCGVSTSGSAYCWGSTPNGAFGDGTVGKHLTPTPTAPGMTFGSIVAGSDFTCALTIAGAAYCWGLGPTGQLGDGGDTNSTRPVPVAGGLSFRSLAAGGQTVCGLTTEGKAYCWGYNFYGTVGDGTSGTDTGPTRRPTPVAVAGGLTFETLSAGYATMCGVTAGGAGYCWGYNYGAVGDGTSDHRSSPTAVAGALTFKRISSGTGYGCGVTTADAIYCWGDNSNGGAWRRHDRATTCAGAGELAVGAPENTLPAFAGVSRAQVAVGAHSRHSDQTVRVRPCPESPQAHSSSARTHGFAARPPRRRTSI